MLIKIFCYNNNTCLIHKRGEENYFNQIDVASLRHSLFALEKLEFSDFNEKKCSILVSDENAPLLIRPIHKRFSSEWNFSIYFFNWENWNFLLLKEQSSSTHTIEFVGQRHCDNLSLQRSIFRTRSISLKISNYSTWKIISNRKSWQ